MPCSPRPAPFAFSTHRVRHCATGSVHNGWPLCLPRLAAPEGQGFPSALLFFTGSPVPKMVLKMAHRSKSTVLGFLFLKRAYLLFILLWCLSNFSDIHITNPVEGVSFRVYSGNRCTLKSHIQLPLPMQTSGALAFLERRWYAGSGGSVHYQLALWFMQHPLGMMWIIHTKCESASMNLINSGSLRSCIAACGY